MNRQTGAWFCHGSCSRGGSVKELCQLLNIQLPAEFASNGYKVEGLSDLYKAEVLSAKTRLLANQTLLQRLHNEWELKIPQQWCIGLHLDITKVRIGCGYQYI